MEYVAWFGEKYDPIHIDAGRGVATPIDEGKGLGRREAVDTA